MRQIINGVVASLGLWLLYATMNEFSNMITKSIAALRMVKDITKRLVVYDTEGGGRGVTAAGKRISPPSLLSLAVVEMGLWVS